jgi:hypothetical protein
MKLKGGMIQNNKNAINQQAISKLEAQIKYDK